MRVTVERETIVSALSFVSKYAKTRPQIPILTHVLLRAAGGSLSVAATNCDQIASGSIAANVGADGAACLPAHLLLKFVKGASASEITFDADDTQAVIRAGKSRIALPVLPAKDFPDMPMLSGAAPHNFMLDGSALERRKTSVAYAEMTASDDEPRFYLCGTAWTVQDGSLEFCATNGNKLSILAVSLPDGAGELQQIIVPAVDLPAWSGAVSIAISDAFIRLSCGGQVVASKLVQGTFPDYRRVVPRGGASLLFDRASLLATVNRMALVAAAREHSILFVGRNGVCTISARSALGDVSEEISYDGEDFQTAVIHSVISPTLASFGCETIEWQWGDHTDPVKILDPRDADRTAVAMPYRDTRLADFIPQPAAAE